MSDFFCRNKFTRVRALNSVHIQHAYMWCLALAPKPHSQRRQGQRWRLDQGQDRRQEGSADPREPPAFVLDKEFRKPYTAGNHWFATLVKQHEFQTVVGDAPFIDVALTAEGDYFDKKAANKDAPKKNARDLSNAMKWFWEKLGAEGYLLWFCYYNYNRENIKMFMTCNAVGGFLQRSGATRKYVLGVMDVCSAEGCSVGTRST
ncbi:hypothetical protein PR003_g1029 [Phytophthora rubi]|uniref:EF-1-gamma C-terminal domain-containing protein n=1 Tax=Phytophthora rubi TaxID=129364 RepID=A0A6A4FWI7_9STRA|nr:hypothetical protein PR003_g1029 [Phytophthora rubi]